MFLKSSLRLWFSKHCCFEHCACEFTDVSKWPLITTARVRSQLSAISFSWSLIRFFGSERSSRFRRTEDRCSVARRIRGCSSFCKKSADNKVSVKSWRPVYWFSKNCSRETSVKCRKNADGEEYPDDDRLKRFTVELNGRKGSRMAV